MAPNVAPYSSPASQLLNASTDAPTDTDPLGSKPMDGLLDTKTSRSVVQVYHSIQRLQHS